jgi:nucleotidyltransferase AbiEii toxin of type IV toxin-antitoxin system
MPLLRDNPDDLQALIGAAAAARDLQLDFVEKDFWMTEVLRAATAPLDTVAKDGSQHAVRTIFKGGTSLSRAYGLIARFSEDVDLLVGFPVVEVSVKAKDTVLKQIRDAVTRHLGLDESSVAPEASTTGVKRYVRYHYRTTRAHTHTPMSSGVLLEMGCRGGTHPTYRHTIRSMVAEYAIDELGESPTEWDEFAAVAVEVLAPERTLLEKIALLHDGVARYPDEAARERLLKAGRHLYDVQRLLTDERVIGALESLGPDGVEVLCADIDDHSAAAGFSYTPRPGRGYRDSLLLDLPMTCQTVLERGYETAMELVYGFRPSFNDCLQALRAHAALL